MLLKHCMKFIAAEITELLKITKQDIVALATTRNKNVVVIDWQLGLNCFAFICSKHILSGNLNNTEVCYDIRCYQYNSILYLNLEANSHRL